MNHIIKQNVIAITGGIATGKTTVAEFLKQQGFTVIDADQLARQVVAPGSEGLKAIAQEFGSDLIQKDGTLNRPLLRAKIFAPSDNGSSRQKLEQLTHPLIRQLLVKMVQQELSRQSYRQPIFYEAALIFETKSQNDFKEVWVTACHPATQLKRLMDRNAWNEQEAQKVISSQIPIDLKAKLADRVIWTEMPREFYLKELMPIIATLKKV